MIRYYRVDADLLCPALAAQDSLRVRAKWRAENVTLGPYLTSLSERSNQEGPSDKNQRERGQDHGASPKRPPLSLAPYWRNMLASSVQEK